MTRNHVSERSKSFLLPCGAVIVVLLLWIGVYNLHVFHQSALPSPFAVGLGFIEEVKTGRLFTDLITSLYRVGVGFLLAVFSGIPTGIWLGQALAPRLALLPLVNFFRNLSPLAWIPFAILWFGVGDAASIFLIVLAAYFPIVIATMAAVSSIPAVYFRVAQSYELKSWEKLSEVTVPAIMPDIITTLRMTAGLCWLVVVAAEMIAGRDGLGFAVMDSRNGLRTDLLVVEMIVIGVIGIILDRVLFRLSRIPSVRWGYER